jgi:hypothetical protein
MMHTFPTREDAAIFAAGMRSDGYMAEILDDGMGAIYGPLAIGGIRVLVSEEPLEATTAAEDGSDDTALGKSEDGEFITTVRMLVVAIVAIALIAMVFMMLSEFSNEPAELLSELLGIIKFPLVLFSAFALMGPAMPALTRWLRGDRVSNSGQILRWLLLAAIVPFLLAALI